MIRANELRIGIILHYPNDIIPFMLTRDDLENSRFWKDLEIIEPIPITSDILEKSGFERDIVEDIAGYILHGQLSIFLEPVNGENGKIDWGTYIQFNIGMRWNRLVTTPPQYVHQLQNIHSALTGEELNIKL